MSTFFKPSSFKIKVTFALVAYILIGSIFLMAYSTTRSAGPHEFSLLDNAGIAVAFPVVFLVTPLLYVQQNMFTTETSLSQMMTESGCTNCGGNEFNKPVQKSTPFGLIAGIIVEVLFLYLIACVVSFLKNYKRKPA